MEESSGYFKSRKTAIAVALIIMIVGTILFIALDAEEKDRIAMEKMAQEKASKIANSDNQIKAKPLPDDEKIESKIQLV